MFACSTQKTIMQKQTTHKRGKLIVTETRDVICALSAFHEVKLL